MKSITLYQHLWKVYFCCIEEYDHFRRMIEKFECQPFLRSKSTRQLLFEYRQQIYMFGRECEVIYVTKGKP